MVKIKKFMRKFKRIKINDINMICIAMLILWYKYLYFVK
jgi:hypothetical protein